MFRVKDRTTDDIETVYDTSVDGNKTLFLCYTKVYGWSWVDSSNFEPLDYQIKRWEEDYIG